MPLPNLAGEKCTAITGLVAGTAYVRLLRYLPGGTLLQTGYLSSAAVAGLGEVAGRVSRALGGFRHPGLDRALQWDLRYGVDVVTRLITHIGDPPRRTRIEAAAFDAWSRIAPLADELRRQATHLDLTDANVVVSRAGAGVQPDGVIDFGDLSDSWTVSELAITASSVLGHPGAEPTSVLPAVRAFHQMRPLSPAEVDALWPLLVLRTAVLIVSGAQQAELDPDNDYITEQSDGEWRMFEQATSVPIEVMTGVIRADLGLASRPDPVTGSLVDIDPSSVVTVDLSTTSDGYDFAFEPDGSLRPDIEDDIARTAVQNGAALVVTQYGQARLSRTKKLSHDSPDVVPTGINVWAASATPVVAPWEGSVVDAASDRITFRGSSLELTLTGVAPSASGAVTVGQQLAKLRPDRWVDIGVRPVGAPSAPLFARADLAPGWLALTRDPRPLLGLSAIDVHESADLLSRRDASFAAVQEFYYRMPPQIERGRRHYLMSTAARTYLDMVNNVTVLGHAHPRIADTAARQLRKLNTNSRFNYEAVVEFSERLAATLPDAAGHRVPGQLRLGGKRSGDPAGDGGDGPARRGRGAGGLPRLDIRHRRGVDLDCRQPERACNTPGLGAHSRVAQQLPRQVPRGGCGALCG